MKYTVCFVMQKLIEIGIKPMRYALNNIKDLENISIIKPDELAYKLTQDNWDAVAKPLDGMGKFEKIIDQIGAIQGSSQIDISKKAVIIMCADNGVVSEGVSQSGQEVTLSVARSMAKKQSSVGKMAEMIGAETIPVDIGINSTQRIDDVLDRKVRCGTRNFTVEPAMTDEETLKAIEIGIDIVRSCKEAGYRLLATGEMGIGNTTTSAAITSALLGCEAEFVTGKGAGLDDEKLHTKINVIKSAVEKYNLYETDAFTVLKTVGGLDIAGLVGVCIGGAIYHIPIVLDGVISMVSALCAERLVSGIKDFIIPSHSGKEPAVKLLEKALEISPVIDGQLALGEGTGAVMMFSLLDMAMILYQNRTTFSDIKVEQYERYESC